VYTSLTRNAAEGKEKVSLEGCGRRIPEGMRSEVSPTLIPLREEKKGESLEG
jgi:hypothetical protein